MGENSRKIPRRIGQVASFMLTGPQVFGFVPAVILAAYWLGGEGAMVASALALPSAFVIAGSVANWHSGGPANRDGQTGLARRGQAEEKLSRILTAGETTGQTAAAIAVELDEFDGVRSQFGQQTAANLMRQVAGRLQTAVRQDDAVVHLTGSRFGIAVGPMPRADLETLIELCGRIQTQIAEPMVVDSTHIYVTACVGFALPGRVPSNDGAAMIECAETALDDARANGSGSIRAYSSGLSRRIRDRHTLCADSVKALENGQIDAWFQPQISTHDGQITGFEAVPFWDHPSRGPVPAREFEDHLAAAGFGERMSEIMLSGALRALRDWDGKGLSVAGVSVALGSDRLADPKLPDKLSWELDRFGLPPSRLYVEINEDVIAAASEDVVIRNIGRLGQLGCRIDLDDFGTGHASIANIRRFGVHRIRIDKSFVARVDRDRDQQNMVAAVLTMAERLSLDTLAEGVETAGEHAMLAQLGCNSVQGYSVSGPMRFSETVAWIEKHNARLPEMSTLRPGRN